MSQPNLQNHRLVLASRPKGVPSSDNFRWESAAITEPGQGEMLIRHEFLSLDPYMRGRMSDAASYAAPVAIGDVMVGGTVGRVLESQASGFTVGDWVLSTGGWQEYSIATPQIARNLGANLPHPSQALGLFGMPGFTAYMGLMDIGQPQAGETVVVAAATGAVGSVVGQLAKLQGCRVVGIAGGVQKCTYAQQELGFDACIDHRAADFAEQLAQACSKGIDVYFESVGGNVFDAVLPLLNSRARIPLCGLISQYNAEKLPTGQDHLPLLMSTLLRKRIRMQGFIIFDDYAPRYPEFLAAMRPLVETGKIKLKEDIVDGLKQAPDAFIGQLQGKNFGKLVVRINTQ